MNIVSASPRHILMEVGGVIARRSLHDGVSISHELEFLPHATEALSLFADSGYSAIVFAARPPVNGSPSHLAFESSMRRFLLDIALAGSHISRLYSWTHAHPETAESLQEQSGLLYRARVDFSLAPSDTLFLGNSLSLLASAAAAGYRTLRIQRGAFLENDADAAESPNVASSLYEVALRLASVSRGGSHALRSNLRFQANALRSPSLRKAASNSGR